MDSQTGDAVEFRAGQRQQWKKGAEGWRKRSDFIDAATAPVSKRMVELARVEPGQPRARRGRGLRRAVAHRGGCGGTRGQGRGHRHLSRDAALRP